MVELKIVLTVEEVNVVLGALSTKPFAEVSDLIFKIKAQGDSQLKAKQEEEQAKEEPVAATVQKIASKTKK